MTDDIKPPPASEPVHIRADQPVTRAAAKTPTDTDKPSPPKAQPGKVKKPPKQSTSGVTSAIVATVVIILGLAGLAVLAYVKTQK
jgi:hypothetical protein